MATLFASAAPRVRGAIIFVVLAAVLMASWAIPSVTGAPPLCLLRALTTIPCPSCGMTRAFIAMGHGDLAAALRLNPAAPFLFCAVWAVLALSVAQIIVDRDLLATAWRRTKRAVVVIVVVLMSVAWAWNLGLRFFAFQTVTIPATKVGARGPRPQGPRSIRPAGRGGAKPAQPLLAKQFAHATGWSLPASPMRFLSETTCVALQGVTPAAQTWFTPSLSASASLARVVGRESAFRMLFLRRAPPSQFAVRRWVSRHLPAQVLRDALPAAHKPGSPCGSRRDSGRSFRSTRRSRHSSRRRSTRRCEP